jgi:hypothetical protein
MGVDPFASFAFFARLPFPRQLGLVPIIGWCRSSTVTLAIISFPRQVGPASRW